MVINPMVQEPMTPAGLGEEASEAGGGDSQEPFSMLHILAVGRP